MAGSVGRSLQLYFIDGNPDGMLTAEVFNWTGHVLMAPRTRIKAALDRKEANHTGVYVLLGDKDSKPFAYIGESENIAERIKNHDQKKDWWTQVIIVATGANILNKAHVKYLESRLVEISHTVKRRNLENGNAPPRPGLTEADQSNMESFLEYTLMVLPAIRVDMFQDYAKSNESLIGNDTESEAAPVPRFSMVVKRHGVEAQAMLVGDDFTVIKGSTARRCWEGRGTEDSGYAQLHEELRNKGVLVEKGDHCVFEMSYAFRSPSAAGAVVAGRPSNGTIEWKHVESGQTYKAWEAAQLDSPPIPT